MDKRSRGFTSEWRWSAVWLHLTGSCQMVRNASLEKTFKKKRCSQRQLKTSGPSAVPGFKFKQIFQLWEAVSGFHGLSRLYILRTQPTNRYNRSNPVHFWNSVSWEPTYTSATKGFLAVHTSPTTLKIDPAFAKPHHFRMSSSKSYCYLFVAASRQNWTRCYAELIDSVTARDRVGFGSLCSLTGEADFSFDQSFLGATISCVSTQPPSTNTSWRSPPSAV